MIAGYLLVRPPPSRDSNAAPNALLPFIVLTVSARLAGIAMRGVSLSTLGVHVAVVGLFVAVVRALLSRTDWAAGWRLMRRPAVLVACFVAFGLVAAADSLVWVMFTYWHYALWFLFQWRMRPEARSRLVGAHVLAGAGYAALFFAAFLIGSSAVPPLLAFLMVSPVALRAQSVLHVLVTLAFRRYPSAA